MNAKMKVLSLALVGLCGFAGSAMAACPSSPTPPWTAVSALQGSATIASPGYAGTECRLDSKINAGASGLASGAVNWAGSTAEPRYRAHFIVNVNGLVNQTVLQGVNIYTSNSTTTGDGVRFSVFGGAGGTHQLGYFVRSDDASGARRYKSGVVTLQAGENHIEFDLDKASSTFKLWVNSNQESNVTKTETGLNIAALNGIDTTYMGLAAPSKQFVTAFAGVAVGFDQFDSRRSTFIGY